jgi:hypothetical protein
MDMNVRSSTEGLFPAGGPTAVTGEAVVFPRSSMSALRGIRMHVALTMAVQHVGLRKSRVSVKVKIVSVLK